MSMCFLLMHVQTKRLQRELSHSEAMREETERKATLAASEVKRLADVANQMEETTKENESLTNQVVQKNIHLFFFLSYLLFASTFSPRRCFFFAAGE